MYLLSNLHVLYKCNSEAVVRWCSAKKVFLKISQNCEIQFCRSEACNFIKKESLAQIFSCEFCEISKNTFFYRTPPVAASSNSETYSKPSQTSKMDLSKQLRSKAFSESQMVQY